MKGIVHPLTGALYERDGEFGDGEDVVHFYERECSLQRRRQKVWEEALSPALNSQQRESIGATVSKAIADLSYSGAGTVEFLYENG